jgi:hypothetical protein
MAMSRRSKRTATRENAAAVADLAAQLAADRTFRKRPLKAIAHGMRAERRVWRQVGLVALVNRLAADRQLRAELAQMLGCRGRGGGSTARAATGCATPSSWSAVPAGSLPPPPRRRAHGSGARWRRVVQGELTELARSFRVGLAGAGASSEPADATGAALLLDEDPVTAAERVADEGR